MTMRNIYGILKETIRKKENIRMLLLLYETLTDET